jgi:hypothetical protein
MGRMGGGGGRRRRRSRRRWSKVTVGPDGHVTIVVGLRDRVYICDYNIPNVTF